MEPFTSISVIEWLCLGSPVTEFFLSVALSGCIYGLSSIKSLTSGSLNCVSVSSPN